MTGETGAPPSIVPTVDAALLSELHRACFDDHWPPGALADLLAAPNALTLVADAAAGAGRAVGYIVLRHAADEAEIISLGVVPGARRSGIASALLARALEVAAAGGVGTVFLEVADDNCAALAFYKSHRFVTAGLRKSYYQRPGGRMVDAIVMRARLACEPRR